MTSSDIPKIHATAMIGENVSLGPRVVVGAYSIVNSGASIGADTHIGSHCIIGEHGGREPDARAHRTAVTSIGEGSLVRSGTIIYGGVTAGIRFETGHRVTIRENATIGPNVRVGTLSDIQGDCSIGRFSRLHSNVHVGKGSRIGDFVWLFPYVVLTNDPHPPSERLLGVTLADFSVVATSSVILPGVTIGRHAVVGAMSLVKQDVGEGMLVVGNPAREVCLASRIRNRFDRTQKAYPWPEHFSRGMPWEETGFLEWQKSLASEDRK